MNKRERAKRVFLWTLGITLLGIAAVKVILGGPFDLGCQLYRRTGYSCSGCGATRMAKALIQGRFYQAFRYNPFIFLSLPGLLILYGFAMLRYIRYNARNAWMERALFLYAIALVVFGILRNISGFRWLLPTTLS